MIKLQFIDNTALQNYLDDLQNLHGQKLKFSIDSKKEHHDVSYICFNENNMAGAPIIFYVDDDLDDLRLFEEAVGQIADVTLFERGIDMMNLLKGEKKPEVVFIDLNMPMKSGYEVIQEIRSFDIQNEIAVVVLSTASDNFSVTKSRDLGANYFIQKPISLNKLRKAVDHTLKIDWKKFKPTYGEFIHKHS